MSLEFVYFDIQALGLMPRLVLKVFTLVEEQGVLNMFSRQQVLILSIPESTLQNGALANLLQKNPVKKPIIF